MAPAAISERTDAPASRDVPPSEVLDILIRAATLLFVNGQTTERTTKAIERVAHAFGFRAVLFLRWGELRVDLSNEHGARSGAVVVNPVAVHMGKVAAAMRARAEALETPSDPAVLAARLTEIEAMAPVSTARFAPMAAAGAAALAVIFGADDILSLLLIAVSAAAGALLRRWVGARSDNPFLQPFCAALLAGMIGAVVMRLQLDVTQRLVVVCPCMILVPGPHLLNGTIDLLRARIALGADRVIHASLIVLAICAGLLIGLSLGGASLPEATNGPVPPLVYNFVAAGIAVAAFGAFFSMPWALLPIPIAIGMLAHAARWLMLSMGGGVVIGAFVACLLVGSLTTPVAQRLNLPFAALGFASVVSLIPGVYLFQMASGLVDLAVLGANAPSALLPSVVSDGATAFMIIMAITLGLIAPKMIIDHHLPEKV